MRTVGSICRPLKVFQWMTAAFNGRKNEPSPIERCNFEPILHTLILTWILEDLLKNLTQPMVCKYYLTRHVSDALKNSAKLSFWDNNFDLSHDDRLHYLNSTQTIDWNIMDIPSSWQCQHYIGLNWVKYLLNKGVGRVHRYALYAFQYSFKIDTDMLFND